MSSTAASTSSGSNLASRLTKYAVMASAIPAAAAQGALLSYNGSPIVVPAGSSEFIDFGNGYGSPFQFSFRKYTNFSTGPGGYRFSSAANALIHFNTASNNYFNFGATTSNVAIGGYIIADSVGIYANDPVRLPAGTGVGYSASFGYMTDYFGTLHDVFNKYFILSVGPYYAGAYSGTYGNWQAGDRGFLGFAFRSNDGDVHFGFFDLELNRNANALIIHGWSFEDSNGVPVVTQAVPAPTAVGLASLALGAAGIRRKRSPAV